jgi:hypothetical protein
VAAVWASELFREAIWNALFNRHTYGTTGPRPAVRFALQDSADNDKFAIMGDEITLIGHPVLLFDIRTDSGCVTDEVTILKNGQVLASYSAPLPQISLRYEDHSFQKGSTSTYMVRCRLRQFEESNLDGDLELKEYKFKNFNVFFESRYPQLLELVWTSPIWVD